MNPAAGDPQPPMKAQTRTAARPDAATLADCAVRALEDLKAHNIVRLDVRGLTGMTDFMVIASGTSNRHVKSLADKVEEALRAVGCKPLGIEGTDVAEWVLVDFGDVLVHVMLPKARDFYDLEHLWGDAASSGGQPQPGQR